MAQEVKEILKNGVDIKIIRKFSNSKYLMPTYETPGGEAPDASENKERRLLDWLKDILVLLSKCGKTLNLLMKRKSADFPRFYFMSSVVF